MIPDFIDKYLGVLLDIWENYGWKIIVFGFVIMIYVIYKT